jgi:hypothetical protein
VEENRAAQPEPGLQGHVLKTAGAATSGRILLIVFFYFAAIVVLLLLISMVLRVTGRATSSFKM